ncbi:MAG: hypothetical protein KF723_01450 [Rhizobiaceae bacterium]|nr:hypothetical protein [Rhizobiaceae bacterium]
MKANRTHLRSTVAALAGVALFASAAASSAAVSAELETADHAGIPSHAVEVEEIVVAAADCYAVGQQVAAQKGGELYGASAANQGGQNVCIVVVLVPGKSGKPPRRIEVVVPAG